MYNVFTLFLHLKKNKTKQFLGDFRLIDSKFVTYGAKLDQKKKNKR